MLGAELLDLALELLDGRLRHLERALVGHAALEQRPLALELQLGEVEIGLDRRQRLLAHLTVDVRVRDQRIGLVQGEPPLGAQPGALGPHALDLRAERIGS